jgi:copper chaperone
MKAQLKIAAALISFGAVLSFAPTAHAEPAKAPAPAQAPAATGDATAKFKVDGMHCGGCASAIKGSLGKLDGVKSVEVTLKPGGTTVVYDPKQVTTDTLKEKIEKLGYKATLEAPGA